MGSGKVVKTSQNKNDLLGRFYFDSERFESPKFCVSKTYRRFGVVQCRKIILLIFQASGGRSKATDISHPQPDATVPCETHISQSAMTSEVKVESSFGSILVCTFVSSEDFCTFINQRYGLFSVQILWPITYYSELV